MELLPSYSENDLNVGNVYTVGILISFFNKILYVLCKNLQQKKGNNTASLIKTTIIHQTSTNRLLQLRQNKFLQAFHLIIHR